MSVGLTKKGKTDFENDTTFKLMNMQFLEKLWKT